MSSLIVFICVLAVGGLFWAIARLLTADELGATMTATALGCLAGAALGFLIVQDERREQAWIAVCEEAGGTLDGSSVCTLPNGEMLDFR